MNCEKLNLGKDECGTIINKGEWHGEFGSWSKDGGRGGEEGSISSDGSVGKLCEQVTFDLKSAGRLAVDLNGQVAWGLSDAFFMSRPFLLYKRIAFHSHAEPL